MSAENENWKKSQEDLTEKKICLTESEKASTRPVTSEDERIAIAESLGNKNQRKLAWIQSQGFVLLDRSRMRNTANKLMKKDAFYKEHMINIADYPLHIPMSALLVARSAVNAGFEPSEIVIIDESLVPEKDPILVVFVSRKEGIGTIVSQWV